jgi:hypothetical protein
LKRLFSTTSAIVHRLGLESVQLESRDGTNSLWRIVAYFLDLRWLLFELAGSLRGGYLPQLSLATQRWHRGSVIVMRTRGKFKRKKLLFHFTHTVLS